MFKKHSQGLTLIEVLTVVIIIAVLAAIAVPSFIALIRQYRVTSIMQNMFYNLQYARSEAIKRGATVYVSFQTGSNWCYGMSTGVNCTCTNTSSCNLGTFTPSGAQLTTLSLTGLNALNFEGSRGAANSAGTITLTITGQTTSMGITVGTLGNLQLCSNNISGYPVCT